jgi:hypothetical protein
VAGAGLSGAFFPSVPIVGPVMTSSTSRVLFAFIVLALVGVLSAVSIRRWWLGDFAFSHDVKYEISSSLSLMLNLQFVSRACSWLSASDGQLLPYSY